jgi:hypothetical protein
VINVRVAQSHGVNLAGIKWETTVALNGFLAVPLEQTAFEQQTFAVDLNEVHGASGGSRGSEEMDVHVEFKICDLRVMKPCA